MSIFNLPDLGEGLPDAEIHEWHVKEGDDVKLDQPLVSVETAKAVVEVPSPYDGKIEKLYGGVGDIIKTGSPLVGFVGDQPAKTAVKEDAGTVVGAIESEDRVITESATGVKPKAASGKRVKIIPAVRALAKKLGVDINSLTPSGPNGLITADDVKQAAQPKAATQATTTSAANTASIPGATPLRGARRAMVASMSQSHSEVVPVTIVEDADIHHWPQGTDITLKVLRAIQFACQQVPAMNAYYDGQAVAVKTIDEINIGVAMDMGDQGLFVPVLKDVAKRDDASLRADIERYKTEVQDRSVPQDDLKGATITLSNFGTFACRYANPIIIPPQVAIIGSGRIREAAVAHKGDVVAHKILPISVSFDHRAVTGGEATQFLAKIIEALQA